MICKNPRQEYLATFSDGLFWADDSEYVVLAVEDTDERKVIAGMVGHDSGLGFAAEFRPQMKVDFYTGDGSLFQTDNCRTGE